MRNNGITDVVPKVEGTGIVVNVPDLSIIGGKANYYSALQDHFSSRVKYFVYGSRGLGRAEGVLAKAGRMFGEYIRYYRQMKKTDVALAHLNPSLESDGFFRDAVFIAIVKILLKKRVIIFWRGWSKEFEAKVENRYFYILKFIYFRADAMIILAQEFEPVLRRWGFERRIFLETTVLDEKLVREYSVEDVHRKFECGTIKLLFLARLEKTKGIFEILEAYENLKKEFSNISLIVAGDGAAMPAVLDYCKNRNLSDVKILGFVRGDAKRQVLHESHIYLFPSNHGEGMPNSLLEAMGCGLSVLTTMNAGIRDFFVEPDMGFVLRDSSANEIISRLRVLVNDKELRSRQGEFNYKYALERFPSQVVVRRLERIYNDVLNLD